MALWGMPMKMESRALELWASRIFRHIVNGTKAQKVVRLRGHE